MVSLMVLHRPNLSLRYMGILNYSLQAWDFSQGHCLFDGEDFCMPRYSTRAHLADIIGLLGPPPEDLRIDGLARNF